MSKNHEKFLKHLTASRAAVWRVARWLWSRGYPVRMNATAAAPDASLWEEYADQGDLEICLTVEVKHLASNQFTCKEDYPYDQAIICAVHSYNHKHPRPFAYILVNAEMTHGAIVYSSTKDLWSTKTIHDSRYNNSQVCYVIDREHLIVQPLESGVLKTLGVNQISLHGPAGSPEEPPAHQ